MKIYLETIEVINNEDREAEFIRAEITDRTDAEILAIRQAMEDVMAGIPYRLSRHLCGHENRLPCRMELIKEVGDYVHNISTT